MSDKATINSKGRITLKDGVTTMQRFSSTSNPFSNCVGRLGGQQHFEEAVQWQRDLRDEH